MLKQQYSNDRERCAAYENTIEELQYELSHLRTGLRNIRIEYDRQVEVSEAETCKHSSLELFYEGRTDGFRLAILALDHRNL
jgi:hypothetical protein